MNSIKESFRKVRKDMNFIYEEIFTLKQLFYKNNEDLIKIQTFLEENNKKIVNFEEKIKSFFKTQNLQKEAFILDNSTHNTPSNGLKGLNLPFSIGNEGVSTDRQTDRQTDNDPKISSGKFEKIEKIEENSIKNAVEMLDSLDNIKKQIRLRFKKLTPQEFSVFTTIYQCAEEKGYCDYFSLSKKLGLSESSIRDYVGRIIKKGVPLDKKKINNKNISLSIPDDLRRVASLPTILQLREL